MKSQELRLRNPRNYTDRLPYDVPDEIRTWYEQVNVDDADVWLDLHPEWDVHVRLKYRVAHPAKAEATASTINASTSAPTTDNSDAKNVAAQANDSAFSKYRWQLPLRTKALQLLDEDPKQKLDALASQLVSVAEELGLRNRSGECLDAATIRRHALLGIHKEHKKRGAK